MDVWNREELYAEIWEQPLVRVATKYGISAVMLGKVGRKLQIPFPGRGYWTKKGIWQTSRTNPLERGEGHPLPCNA
jgi:hypothetical protein